MNVTLTLSRPWIHKTSTKLYKDVMQKTQFTCRLQRHSQTHLDPDSDLHLQPRPDPVPVWCWSCCVCQAGEWRWSWPGDRRCRPAAEWTSSDIPDTTSTSDLTPTAAGRPGRSWGRRHRTCGWSTAECAGRWRCRGRWDTRSTLDRQAAAVPMGLLLHLPATYMHIHSASHSYRTAAIPGLLHITADGRLSAVYLTNVCSLKLLAQISLLSSKFVRGGGGNWHSVSSISAEGPAVDQERLKPVGGFYSLGQSSWVPVGGVTGRSPGCLSSQVSFQNMYIAKTHGMRLTQVTQKMTIKMEQIFETVFVARRQSYQFDKSITMATITAATNTITV